MSLSTTQIKLYGPGISNGLKKLEEIENKRGFSLHKKIKHSGGYIGEEADYEIFWKETPEAEDTLELVKYLDNLFTGCECRYTVSTNVPAALDVIKQLETSKEKDLAFTFVRLIGPSISRAITALNEKITDFHGIKEITGELIGRFDYAFEWLRIPEPKDIMSLSETMDSILKDTGAIFTIATKSKTRIMSVPRIERHQIRSDPIQFVLHRKI